MKISIELDQDNQAFKEGYFSKRNCLIRETQRILYDWVVVKAPYGEQGFHKGWLYDLNGNKCGKWEVINK